MTKGKCPKCDGTPSYIKYAPLDLGGPAQNKWKGVVYSCPFCDAILGVEADFLALKNNIVSDLLEALGR